MQKGIQIGLISGSNILHPNIVLMETAQILDIQFHAMVIFYRMIPRS